MKCKILLISIFTLGLLIILGSFRWEQRESDNIFSYKYDRWAKQLWVEFTPEIGTNDIIDIPLLYVNRLSTNEVESYLTKLGVTGQGVNIWVYRVRLSDVYIGLLIANLTIILFICMNIIRRRIFFTSKPN
ncbi:hypothetical protein J2T13_002548 [Paenibacillus sp. DS2015]